MGVWGTLYFTLLMVACGLAFLRQGKYQGIVTVMLVHFAATRSVMMASEEIQTHLLLLVDTLAASVLLWKYRDRILAKIVVALFSLTLLGAHMPALLGVISLAGSKVLIDILSFAQILTIMGDGVVGGIRCLSKIRVGRGHVSNRMDSVEMQHHSQS